MYIRKFCFFLILLCLIWFPLQDTIISLLYRLYPSDCWRVLLVSKELLVVFTLILLFIRKMLIPKLIISSIEIIGLFYLLLCIFYFLFVKSELAVGIATLTTFRSAILPILFVLVSKWLDLKEKEAETLFKIVIFVSIFSVGFGFIEMFIPVDKFWNGVLNLYGYLTNIKGLHGGYAGGFIKNVPANFWGFVGARRMAGTFASPLALGYYLILPILLLSSGFFSIKKKGFILLFLICGLLLTETRAAIVGLIIGLLFYYIEFKKLLFFRLKKIFLIFISLVFFFFVVLFLFKPTQVFIFSMIGGKESRIMAHIEALQRSLANIQETILIGKGFGSAGGWASLQGSKIVGAGESTYLSIMYQIGGFGLLIFLIWWFLIFAQLKKQSLKYRENDLWKKLFKATICMNIAYFLTGFISEQILTFTSVAHFWIFSGLVTSLSARKKSIENIEITRLEGTD